MASLKEVRNRITSISSTQQITKAMKMVAAAKLKRAQDNIIQLRPYADKLQEILQNVSSSASDDVQTVYSTKRNVEKVLVVVVTSDRGLCGGFNSSIFKAVTNLVNEKYSDINKAGNLTLLSVGKKGMEFFARRDFKINNDYTNFFLNISFEGAKDAAEYAMDSFADGTYDEVVIVYNEFKNVATQVIKTEQFLPIGEAETVAGEAKTSSTDYIFEPSQDFIVQELIPKSLKIQFYKTLLESNASEHGARMTAMDKATDNAGELLKELKLVYNRTRQAAITTEILEIVGGAEALSNG